MKPSLKLYLWLFTFQLGALSKPGWGDRPVAQLDSGTAVGFTKTDVLSGVKLNAWLGIPFAGEPLRWGPPKPPKTWGAPFDASKLGPACIQQFNYPEPRRGLIRLWFNTPTPTESEDCLNVCVYAPYGHHKKPKAVLVWYYGGGLLYGSNAVDKYDFSNMAANNDVVVVVPNYRTNGFGFPGSPQIPVEEGNPGLLDQRLALDWVRRNIAAFGGDPEQVTIFGESAGAASVDYFLSQPPEPLNFRAAIMQSGTSTFRARPANPANGWNILVNGVGCTNATDVLECMRSVPVDDLKSYQERNRVPWAPIFDNVTSAFAARSNRLKSTQDNPGAFARVPILGGSNADEGRLYSVSAVNATSFLKPLLGFTTDDQVYAFLENYPLSDGYKNEFEQLAAPYRDFIFQCPARLVHLETAQVGVPSWRYYYNASFPNLDIFEDAGVYHSSEIALVSGTFPANGSTPYQHKLSRYIQKVWTDFAKDPYKFGQPPWSQGSQAMAEVGNSRVGTPVGEEGPLLTVLDSTQIDEVDKHCQLYQPLYDLLSA